VLLPEADADARAHSPISVVAMIAV
jgi:hypothetical protein